MSNIFKFPKGKKNIRVKQEKAKELKKPSLFMEKIRKINWDKLRIRTVAIFFSVVWLTLWLRTGYLQVVIGSDLREQSHKQHSMTQLVTGKRGNIYDRNGEVLARSVEVLSIYAHPNQISDPLMVARILAPILKSDEQRLLKLLEQKRNFVWISRKVDDATSKAISKANIPGLGLIKEYERVYPYKHLAGQLLGFVGIDNEGLEGVERSFDSELTGTSQKFIVPRDIAGRTLFSIDDDQSIGKDIELTLDVQIQFIAEEIIADAVENYDAKWGGVLIADPKSGDVLAWAQYPFFNPNNFRNYKPEIYRNRLANDALEPGSTLKPLIVAAALEAKAITKDSIFFCENGTWKLDHIKIGNTRKTAFRIGDDGRAFKDLNVEEIIRYSSNIGMAKITQAMGSEKLATYIERLGFGKSTGIGITEGRGIVRSKNDFSELDILSTGFGQSISVTSLQLLSAYNVLVNDGKSVSLNLIKNDEPSYVAEKSIFSKENANEVMKMMESVVQGKGTGVRARIEGVRVAGKTGTAQKAAKNSSGYGEERMASFVGILPVEDPRYLIITILDEPKTETYGGVIAAPVFQKIARRTMAYNGEFPSVTFAPENEEGKNKENKQVQEVKIKAGVIPNVTNLSLRKAIEAYKKIGIIPKIVGQGMYVVMQNPQPGTVITGELNKLSQEQADSAEDMKNIQAVEKEYIIYLSLPQKELAEDENIEDELVNAKSEERKELAEK